MYLFLVFSTFSCIITVQSLAAIGWKTCEELKKKSTHKSEYKCIGKYFSPVQCSEKLHSCFCVDVRTGSIKSYSIIIKNVPPQNKLMTCECTSKSHTYNFKNVKPACDKLGNFAPTCYDVTNTRFYSWKCDKKTGFFTPVRCYSFGCYCIDPLTGNLLYKYYARDKALKSQMNCKCAIDEYHHRKPIQKKCLSNGNYEESKCVTLRKSALKQKCQPNLFTPDCDKDGYFFLKQCFGNRCFCVDPKTGQRIGNYEAQKLSPEESVMNCGCAYKEFSKKKPYECHSNGNKITDCQIAARKTFHLLGVFKPRCNPDGTYTAKQCHESICWCVDKDGKKLKTYSGTVGTNETNKMDCRCARDEAENPSKTFVCSGTGNYQSKCNEQRSLAIKNSNRYLPWCSCDGSFGAIQCKDTNCFCADMKTGEKLGSYSFDKNSTLEKEATCQCARDERIYLKAGHALTVKCTSNGNYEKCTDKLYKQSFKQRNEIPEPVECECKNSFKPVQCDKHRCYCTNKHGHHISNFGASLSGKSKLGKCQCARDLDEYVRSGLIGKLFNCDQYGDYINSNSNSK